MKKEITTNKVASAPNILSQAIEVNGFVFLSGQIGVDTEWKLVKGGVEAETKKAMGNIKIILEEVNLTMDSIVKVTIYTTNLSQSKIINDVYMSFFSESLPAREMTGVKELPLGASIEISVIATR